MLEMSLDVSCAHESPKVDAIWQIQQRADNFFHHIMHKVKWYRSVVAMFEVGMVGFDGGGLCRDLIYRSSRRGREQTISKVCMSGVMG